MLALFPGQGSQHVGMGKDLFDNFSIARDTFEEASDSIKKNLKKLCFEGPDSELTLTENTQPSLLVTSVAAYRVAQKECGFQPQAVAGHSLGEYSALVALGTLPLSAATRWVQERGAAMQRAVPAGEGTMAAIMGLEDEKVEELCRRATEEARSKRSKNASETISVEAIVEPANFNSPGQVVIAGSQDAVSEAVALIKEGGAFPGGKAIPLSVSAPFHCRLMKPAREKMAELFSRADSSEMPKTLSSPYIPNRTGRLTHEAKLVFELLVDQVDRPVLWKQSMSHALESGLNQAIEFGPGNVLQGLLKRIAKGTEHSPKSMGVSETAGVKNLENFLSGK